MYTLTRLNILKNLIWPAAAGNVAWSFFTLFLESVKLPDANQTEANLASANKAYSTDPNQVILVITNLVHALPNLLVLGLVSIYLTLDWLRLRSETEVPRLYFWADIGHVVTLVGFALCIQGQHPWTSAALIVLFVWVILSHWVGAWRLATGTPIETNWIFANGMGLGIFLLGLLGPKWLFPWLPLIALAMVFTMWVWRQWDDFDALRKAVFKA